tara:strand:+ start:292 stop:510 length:219 start_codon:yes stop_codon:yes gene_type:complete
MSKATLKELKQQIAKLKKEIERLTDENSSLWFMLDEIEKSNIKNPEYQKQFKQVFEELRFHTLMTHSKVEDA